MEITTPEQAVRRLPPRGRILVTPVCGMPVTLFDALYDTRDHFDDLDVHTGLMFEPVRALAAVPKPFRLTTTHVSGAVEALVADGRADFLPARLSQIPALYAQDGPLPIDALLLQVSPPDERGHCTLGASVCIALDLVPQAPLVIAEINWQAPRTTGNWIHISQIRAACEIDRPLLPLNPPKVGELEQKIANHVAALIDDGDCFQIGIGAIPQAILEALGGHKDLGIHSGMICDGMVPLIENGVANGARKNIDRGQAVGGEAMGTELLYRFVDCNPAVSFVSVARSHNVDYVRRINNFVAINSAIEVDLHGQVNAEWVAGRQISGIGGQFDFVEAAAYSKGGRSIVALPSTAARGGVSRIVRTFAAGTPVTTPRFAVDFVVTEYGVADLRGKGLHARAKALAAIAHPHFRDELLSATEPPRLAERRIT